MDNINITEIPRISYNNPLLKRIEYLHITKVVHLYFESITGRRTVYHTKPNKYNLGQSKYGLLKPEIKYILTSVKKAKLKHLLEGTIKTPFDEFKQDHDAAVRRAHTKWIMALYSK